MGESIAFLTIPQGKPHYRPVDERIKDYHEVALLRETAESQAQASRCLSCFLPFCHWACPIGNNIPDWNQAIARGDWAEAYRLLQATNNIPEVTGRICPASCEPACVLGIKEEGVTIRENELAIIEHAFQAGWVVPHPPTVRTGQSVAVVGSGPAGLCCADQLNKAGHRVVVFERDQQLGGMLRYGIPDFKMEKQVLDRCIAVWRAEGIEFTTGASVGTDISMRRLQEQFSAVCLTGGSRLPRDLQIEGRTLGGIHFAMAYLTQSNQRVAGQRIPASALIDAKGKRVVVIGGGDTGADCVGTAHRQGASQVVQIELLPQPPERRGARDLWPDYPAILRTSSSHEEGAIREWAVQTQRFLGVQGMVRTLSCVRVEWTQPDPQSRPIMREIPESTFDIDADLVLLAMGFLSPEPQGPITELGLRLDARGNIATDEQYQTSTPGVFAAGDMRRGQSLVVWAISEGRRAAHFIDAHLIGHPSQLPLI